MSGTKRDRDESEPSDPSQQGFIARSCGEYGTNFVVGGGAATAIAHYPHMRRVNGFLYVSGTSSRREDNTHEGADRNEDGSWTLDVEKQTIAVLENIQRILKAAGATLDNLVECTCYLTDMKHYQGFNKGWNTFFQDTGPTRTCVAVHQLPHPNLLIEIKSLAVAPSS